MMSNLKMSEANRRSVLDVIWVCHMFKKGIKLIYGADELYAGVPPALQKCGRVVCFSDLLKAAILFSGLSDEVIGELCLNARKTIFAPRAVVARSGEICYEMHIILQGKCFFILTH